MKQANLAVRFQVELCALATLAYSGFGLDAPILVRVVLGVATPLIAAIAWGAYVASRARLSAPASMRLAVELVVLGAAVLAIALTGPAWPGHLPPLSSSTRR
jgi:drug/metabolite transporter (DMT)-like permease